MEARDMQRDGGEQRRERIDFLKNAVAFNEASIRSYDTKAQIGLAAFVLSFGPILTVLNALPGLMRLGLVACATLYIVAIGCFLFVLWPVTPARSATDRKGSHFYPQASAHGSVDDYRGQVRALDVEEEFTREVMSLASIRAVKAVRFRCAVGAAGVFYAVCLVFIYKTLVS